MKRFMLAFIPTLLSAGTNFSFTGTFTSDSDVQYITFTVLNPTTGVALRTWSYSGGVNGAGDTIAAGGFEQVLNLFDPTGQGLNPGTSGPCTVPTTGNPIVDLLPDPTTGGCGDVYYPATRAFPSGTWDPGTYTIALTMFANQAVGSQLGDGFFGDVVLGIPPGGNWTCSTSLGFQGTPPTVPEDAPFCDEYISGVERDGHWALDIYNVNSASLETVPEPATGALVLVALGIAATRSRSLGRPRS